MSKTVQIMRVAMFLALIVLSSTGFAQTIVRGPYWQQATPNAAIVRWRTDLPTDSVVRYGITPNALSQSNSTGQQLTEHEISVGPLQPDTRYFYSIGNSSDEFVGGDFSHTFVTPPADDVDKPTRIWVTGDAGTAGGAAARVRDAYKVFTGSRHTDIWLTLGDIAYLHGTDAQFQTAFFDMYPEVLRQTPVWPTFGNHDGASADSDTQSGPYYDIFSLPTAAEAGGVGSLTEAYYSFDYGIIHFISLDSFDSVRTSGGSMIPWLINDLAANDKEWTIAFWHHPPYSKGSHDSDVEGPLIEMRENAVVVLESYGVDLVLTGHSHSYERSYLLDGHYGPSTTLEASMLLDSGAGREDESGAYLKPGIAGTPHDGAVYAVAGSSGWRTDAPLNHPAMYMSLFDWGSMVLDVSGNRLDGTFLDDAGAVRDYFTIIKGDDTFAPTVVSADFRNETEVTVVFSEPMDPVSTENTDHFDIGGLTLWQAVLQSDQRTIVLTTSPMTRGATYNLTINDVEDLTGNPIAANTKELFTFPELVTRIFQQGALPSSSYSGARDAFLNASSPDANTGTYYIVRVDGDDPTGTGLEKSALMRWELGQIPEGVMIQSVSIEFEVTNPSNDAYSFYEMKRDWQQAEVTWNQYSNGVAWSAPGAMGTTDRGTTLLGTVISTVTGINVLPLNAAGVALVQSWIDGVTPNFGFILPGALSNDGLTYSSNEAVSPSIRPRLVIDYQGSSVPSDGDGDGIVDALDNCVEVANGPFIPDAGERSQIDSDDDGFGNLCDPDFNNNGVVDSNDASVLFGQFGKDSVDPAFNPAVDLNGNGVIDSNDAARLFSSFGSPPGP